MKYQEGSPRVHLKIIIPIQDDKVLSGVSGRISREHGRSTEKSREMQIYRVKRDYVQAFNARLEKANQLKLAKYL